LTSDELDELMTRSWNMRVATVGPAERINLTPLWFGWAGGRVYFYCRGQKIANLRRNRSCTILVDRNEQFPELQGVMFQGTATVLEDAAAEEADPHLEEVRWQMGTKYAGGHGEPMPPPGEKVRNPLSARGRSWRWVAFQPDKLVTWDNRKLPAR
jgi:nitroimidazol reductase NimA-like FMN-containing flavoprotein (pyridoxamine 5'-phosphate oxidase superfamily)